MKVIFDANNLAHICWNIACKSPTEDTSLLMTYYFFKQAFKFAKKFNTSELIFCWDSLKSKRRLIYPDYKANRGVKDERHEFFKEIDAIKANYLPALGFNSFIQSGYEADDLIAKICIACNDNPLEKIIICSNDKDLYQCLTPNVSILGATQKSEIYDYSAFLRNYGVEPYVWSDVKAITGCTSDNIKGIEGVGEVTALKYIKGKLSRRSKGYLAIEKGKNIIVRNKLLVTLPFDDVEEMCLYANPCFDKQAFLYFFETMGFDSFLKKDFFNELKSIFIWI